MTDLLRHFRTTRTTFQMLWNEIPSHSAVTCFFFMRLEECIHKMHFHLPLLALTLFRTSQKPPQVSVKTFLQIKGFLFEIWRFHHSFDTSTCALKQGDGNPASDLEKRVEKEFSPKGNSWFLSPKSQHSHWCEISQFPLDITSLFFSYEVRIGLLSCAECCAHLCMKRIGLQFE